MERTLCKCSISIPIDIHSLFLCSDLESNEEGQRALKKAYNSGHQIASHTLSHKDLDTISGEEFDSELTELERIVHDLIGVK